MSDAVARAGQGRVGVAFVQGQSEVVDLYATSPLRLLTPRSRGEAAWVVQSSLGGGLVDGDAPSLAVRVGRGARALLLTQASTKVYRSPRGTSQQLEAVVEADALLVSWPDPLTCFAGANFAQSTRVQLEASASVLLVDAFTAGRVARHERWAASHHQSRLQVEVAGGCLVDETLRLDPLEGPIAERFGRFDAFATVLLWGPYLAEAREAVAAAVTATPLEHRAPVVESVSPLGEHGLWLRCAATTTPGLSERLRQRLAFVPGLAGGDLHRGKA